MPTRSRTRPPAHQDELALLATIRRRAATVHRPELRLGIGDDCALLRPRRGEEVAITTDLSLEGRHFRLDWHSPESVGHRALARGLSDLAAMGARPLAAFLSLGVPGKLTRTSGRNPSWTTRFYDGLLALASSTGTPLAGGDLAQAPLALADIVLVGAVAQGKALLRSGARPGDRIYVTGQLGGAAAGLAALAKWGEKRGGRPAGQPPKRLEGLLRPHLFPQPRLAQGLALVRRELASAAMDVSDGLAIDLARLCQESGVRARIEAERLPVAAGATLEQALHGGEDYELLFTARPEKRIPGQIAGVAVSCIGEILKAGRGSRLTLRSAQGPQPLEARGWRHFA